MNNPQTLTKDALEQSANETIAMCGGDAYAAVKALLVANDFLERELELATAAVSYGFSRGWHSQRRGLKRSSS